MRVATYARYSSDLQRPTSIEDQVRECRREADAKGWTVLEEFIRSDSEFSGQSVVPRDGINSLLDEATKRPRPFDCLMIDDTSRLGRNLGDVLRVSDILSFAGIVLYFVTKRLDSRDPNFRQLLSMNGIIDEQYLVSLADAVRRGQEGRLLNGYNPGGSCYGYRNVPVEDPTRIGEYGRPAVIGVRQEIKPEEAAVVLRMCEMYATGSSLRVIAKTFNKELITPPKVQRGHEPGWSPNGLRDMLRNERYVGRVRWNRSYKVKTPQGTKQQRKRPKEKWIIVDQPWLRIVPDELWNRVQARIEAMSAKYHREGGIQRAIDPTRYLMSGLMKCGICGRHIVIVNGFDRNAMYGCPGYRYKGVCPNELRILHHVAERQFVPFIIDHLLQPDMIEYAIARFLEKIESDALAEEDQAKKDKAEQPKLKTELRRLDIEAKNLVDAIAAIGHQQSPALLSRLGSVETRAEFIRERLKARYTRRPEIPIDELRAFVLSEAKNLEKLLMGDRALAKSALRAHIPPMVFTPKETPEGPVYRVQGELDLFSGLSDVMQMESLRAHQLKQFRVDDICSPLYLVQLLDCLIRHFNAGSSQVLQFLSGTPQNTEHGYKTSPKTRKTVLFCLLLD